jgi:hypothetical protein
VSSWWLNGAVRAAEGGGSGGTQPLPRFPLPQPLIPRHTSGYTSIVIGLPGLSFGGGDNLLAARVDGTETTGWWYEGAGQRG